MYSGEEAVSLVAEVLEQEGITLSPHNLQSYRTKVCVSFYRNTSGCPKPIP